MQKFFIGIIVGVLSDEKVQQMIKNMLSDLITEKIAPLVPLAVGSAFHKLSELMPGVTATAEDVVQVVDQVREDLNKAIPDIDIGIPLIDNIVDAWRPRG